MKLNPELSKIERVGVTLMAVACFWLAYLGAEDRMAMRIVLIAFGLVLVHAAIGGT